MKQRLFFLRLNIMRHFKQLSIIFLMGLLFMKPMFAAQESADFIPSINVVSGPPPFTINVTGISFGSITPSSVAPCSASVDFNNTPSGVQGGDCPAYSGGSVIGVIELQGTNPGTDPLTVVSISGPISDYLLENGATQITGSVPAAAADLSGGNFVDCAVRADMPVCNIYLGNTFITIPSDAASGAYTADNAPVQVNLFYN